MLVLVERWLSMVYSTGEIELNHTSNRMMRHIIIFLSSSVYVIICNFTEMDNVEIFQVQSMWKYTLINGEARWIHWEKKNVEYSLVISLTAYEFSLINKSNHILILFFTQIITYFFWRTILLSLVTNFNARNDEAFEVQRFLSFVI